ncbi:hypothetical protein VCCP1035_1200B, partial [Vibrio cholerae CP1035(8)]
CSTN